MQHYFITKEQFETLLGGGSITVTKNGASKTITYSDEDMYHVETDVAEKSHVDDMFLKIYTTEVMNTSSLPSIQVPKLTAEQISSIQTAISQGKEVTVDASYGGITNQFKVLESDHDGDVGGVRFTYYNNYLDYVLDGEQVTATHTAIGGGEGGGGLTVDLLWKNASRTSNFNAQTISVEDISNYDYVIVLASFARTYGYVTGSGIVAVKNARNIMPHSSINIFQTASNSNRVIRDFTIFINENKVDFNDAYIYENNSATGTSYNNYCIPIEIYGINI